MKINNRLLLFSTLILLILSILSSVYNIQMVYSLTSFSSDFETGNISQWTGTVYGGDVNTPIVQQNTVYNGNYALQTTKNGGGWSVVYKDLTSPENLLYFRSYVRFTALPDVGQFVNIYPMIAASSSIPLAYMHLYNDAGILKWRLAYKTDTVAENFAYSNTPTIQTNQWYYIEIMYKIGYGDGEAKAWIAPAGVSMTEYSPTISVTGLINYDYNIGHLQLGVYGPSSLSLSVFHDCVITANEYIGIESSVIPPSPSPSPSYSPGIISITFDDGTRSQYTVAFPLMRDRGIVGTFYIPTAQYPYPAKLYNQLSTSELLEMQAAGNEIGSHSVTHRDFTTLSDQEIIWEASTSKQYLQSNGLIVNNFAYPYGTGITTQINSILANYYRSARVAVGVPMTVVQFELNSTHCGWGLNVLKGLVDRAKTQNMWVTFYFHDIGSEFSTADFISLLDYAKASDVRILTVSQALDQFT